MFGLRLGKLGAAIKAGAGSAGVVPLFSRDYSAGTLGASATFARSSSATIIDHEGVIRTVPSGAARFNGLRYVRNLYTKTEDFSYAGWTKTLCTVASGYTDPDGGSTAWRITSTGSGLVILKGFNISLADGTELLNSWWVRRVTGSGNVLLYTGGGTATTGISPTSSWQRFVANKGTTTSGTDVIGILIAGATASDVIEVWHPQYEDVTGRADTATPSEYVSVGVESSPYHGANVDGIKYFATENGNSVVSNVVTEGTGAAIVGGYLLMEPAATNLADGGHDFGGGADTITLSATGNYTLSVYGTAAVTIAAGTATITGGGQATEGSPVTINCTATGTVTLTLDSGTLDTVDEKQAIQLEPGTVATSLIPTSGSAVTRAADSLSYSGAWAADNETRAITDAGTVDVDDWDGVVDATINGADNLAQISSITVYTTGDRPA